jgi:HAD superfamily hydrolase (TIGR01549 family)
VGALLLKAILFDLDGTLLDVDMDVFLQQYFKKLAVHCSPFMDPKAFVPHLLSSTQAMMISRNPNKTNQEAFWEHFTYDLTMNAKDVMPHIEDFYRQVFPQLREHTKRYSSVPAIMEAALSLKCPLVLATNPVFPLAAIRHRLNWAGLTEDMFTFITSYETMHYCKPHPEYYHEITSRLGVNPENCLMIGNDADDDICAANNVGMKTYLATNLVVNHSGCDPQADYYGKVEELPTFLETLRMDCDEEANPFDSI